MSRNSVTFCCTALSGINKAGILKKNENGYYPMVVGALNVFNSAGQFYVFEQAKELFQTSSQLMRRVSRGSLRGELGHPKILPGMTNDQFANRIMSIYEENVCCHHKSLTLDFDNVKDEQGKPVIAIISELIPAGPMGPQLEKSLNNKDENVAFSIRAFTDDYREGGVTKRVLKNVITFDQVIEGGISVANKYMSPALESDGMVFTRGDLERGLNNAKSSGISTESSLMNIIDLFKTCGWDDSNISRKPAYTVW